MIDYEKQQEGQRHYYPALRGIFGDWVYYSCLMSVKEVAARLSFADEVHRSKKLSEWIQRRLQKGRSKDIMEYLLREKQRFFNSLVVAIYGGDAAWHGFSKIKPRLKDIDLANVPDEVEDSIGFLSFAGNERLFAVDGQHRLAGMKEAIKAREEIGKDEASLLIVKHERSPAGQERTRRLFTTLNKTARPVGKGDIIALDEDDVMAIVTRFLVEHDPWFRDDRIKFSQTDSIAVDAPELTTIGNIYDVLTILFTQCSRKKGKLDELRFIRPDELALKVYISLARKFFRGLAAHFSPLNTYFKSSAQRSPLVILKYRTRTGGHVLFRPVGLRIFAEIAGALVKHGESLTSALRTMSQLPVDLRSKPYRGVIYQSGGRMNPKGRALCRRLLLFMLGYEKNTKDLHNAYADFLGVSKRKAVLPKRLN